MCTLKVGIYVTSHAFLSVQNVQVGLMLLNLAQNFTG